MMYACITVLRALALKEGPSKIWEDYTRFDSHLEQRMKTEVYTKVRKIISASSEAGFLVRVHPEPCLILSRAQIRALVCSSKSKFIPA
jgi:hypothetical protein